LKPDQTGIHFQNTITANDSINLMSYEYLYNGGGVGMGHFNNDSLPDIFFTGNQVKSTIYLNQGELRFEDITNSSGIDTKGKWCRGVSVVDINSDGLDDLYISVGGMGNKDIFPNLLYVNQGDATFKEEASKYGLDDMGESIQSVFFDYDLDGDLDMYLLTGGGFEYSAINARPIIENGSGRNTDRLYRNDIQPETGQTYFTNVSKEAGIKIEGFGLGVSVFDVNQDAFPDIYVSNDYLSRDLLYVNKGDGTFSENGLDYFGHMSHFSMGNDVADIDNDGLLDVITMDMLPENYKRRKLMSGASSYDFFQMILRFGYGHQHMRNMLHKNNGNNRFSEIGQMAGIDRTDWSWSPLLADFDNDGHNDLFITNGYGKDITDLDFVKFRQNSTLAFSDYEELRKSVIDCLKYRPAINMDNYVFKNNGNLTFSKKIKDWGFDLKSISNGAAYSDLDLDGDLDLVINNINQPAFVYRNNLQEFNTKNANYLRLLLTGPIKNRKGFGAIINIYRDKEHQTKYNQPVRGFQSTVDGAIHFGLNNNKNIDSVEVIWPDRKKSVIKNVNANQTLQIDYSNSTIFREGLEKNKQFLKEDSIVFYTHTDRSYNDYAIQPLLSHGFSNQGPGMAVGEFNSDGLEDVFVGGSYGSKSTLLIQKSNGIFDTLQLKDTEMYEDQGALFFDANGDGQQDLYVVSGGSERYNGHEAYQDRLYLNDYKKSGGLIRMELPKMTTSNSIIVGGDYDNDGDIDLFVGGRVIPGSYPEIPPSYLLENQAGSFVDVTDAICPQLKKVGMVTSAVWTDYDNDYNLDLVVVGEYMPISLFKGNGEKLTKQETLSGLEKTSGLWNSIVSDDFDNDGDMDFVLGNLGVNSNIKVTKEHSLNLHYSDFDGNGSIDPILSVYEQGDYYPSATLDELTKQLPSIKKKILYYNTYAQSTTSDVLDLFDKKDYNTLSAEVLESSYVENKGNGNFVISALPKEAQIAPVNGILSEDINADGLLDLILVGNNYNTEVVYGRYDASIGTVLLNQGNNSFKVSTPEASGLSVVGDSKSIVRVRTKDGKESVLIGRNKGFIASFTLAENAMTTVLPNNGESYAVVIFEDSSTRKIEFSMGGGYLSQSSNSIRITPKMESLTIYDSKGNIKRTLNFKNKE
tara:strand:- start:13190 stop:16612 length:3423 start_codon:yes stop_codon:yes gene_type:complete